MFFYGQKPPNHSSMCVVWNGIKCTAAFGISLYSQVPLGHMLEPWASTLMESTKDQRNARSSEFILSFSSAKPGLSCQHLFPLFLLALSELVQSFMECWVKKWWREVAKFKMVRPLHFLSCASLRKPAKNIKKSMEGFDLCSSHPRSMWICCASGATSGATVVSSPAWRNSRKPSQRISIPTAQFVTAESSIHVALRHQHGFQGISGFATLPMYSKATTWEALQEANEATSDKLQVPNGSKGFAVAISLVLCASALKLLCAEA